MHDEVTIEQKVRQPPLQLQSLFSLQNFPTCLWTETGVYAAGKETTVARDIAQGGCGRVVYDSGTFEICYAAL
jgi:hypothetical protein